MYSVKLSSFSGRFLSAMIGKHWKKRVTHRRHLKLVNDFSSNSSSSSMEGDSSDDEFVYDGSYSVLGNSSYIPISKENFFRPVVFSWSQDKCYY